MTKRDWLDLAVLARKQYNCLSEVLGLSQQLGEALDRSDDVSVRLLVSMRQDPILRLEEIKAAIGSKRDSMPPEEWERVNDLNGGAQPQDQDEKVYLNQVGSVRRILERVLELDRRLNRRLAGENSFYAQEK